MQNKIFYKTFNFSNIARVRRAMILKRAIKKRSKELILKMKKIWSSPITLKGAKKVQYCDNDNNRYQNDVFAFLGHQ